MRWQGALFSISRQTPRILLYYLASLGKMVARDELLTLFWPEASDSIARLRLRETLNKLRKGLPAQDILFAKGELVSLDFEKTYVDLLEFHELVTQVGRLPWKIPSEEPLPSMIHQKLHRAYQLWRRPNVLAGAKFSFSSGLDAWFSNIIIYNENIYRKILERLADHEAAVGNLEAALNMTRQLLVNHELEEVLHARALSLLIQMGQTKEARAYFKEVQYKLQKEINSLPGPELSALYHQIQNDTRPLVAKDTTRWNIHFSMQVLFVGRQKYLQQLHQAYQKGGSIFLLGESGQGKTRLLNEFTNQLQPPPRLLLAQCRPTESNLPFQPLTDLFRQNTKPKDWLGLPRVWANQLLVLFPELSTLRSDLSAIPEAHPQQARSLLFEAIRQLCLVLSKSQRLLMILDDSQWIDEASLSAITYLISRSPFDKQSLLIIAARLEDKNPYLEATLTLLKHSYGSLILNLTRMDLNEIDDLVHQVLGTSPSPKFVERLAQDTGGNPFFILETLHALVKLHPNPDLHSLDLLPLADSLYSLIQNRVSPLSQQSHTVLEIASLIGNEFRSGTIIKASELSEEEVAAALEELEERLFFTRSDLGGKPARYRFIHDKFRESLLRQISPMRAQIAHRKIAFALLAEENEQSNSQSAVLAYHFEAAEEWYLAYQHWIKAAQHAHQLYAVSEAYQAFSSAENLIEQCISSLDDHQIYALYREWGEMAFASNDTLVLQAMNTSLMKFGERLKSPLLKGTALVRLGNACFSSGQLEEGLEYIRLAIIQLSKTDNLYQLIGARTTYGVFLYMAGRITEALQVLKSTLRLMKNNKDNSLIFQRASLNYELGISLFLNGWPQKSLEYFVNCLQDFKQINNLDGMATAFSGLTLISYFLGDYPKAFQYSQQGIEAARQSQSWRTLGYHSAYRAMLELAVGNLDGMMEFVDQAVEVGRRIGQADIYSSGYRVISDAFYFLEDYPNSLENIQLASMNNQKSFIAIDTIYRMKALRFLLEHKNEDLQDLFNIINQTEASGLFTGKLLAQTVLAMAYRNLNDKDSASNLAKEIQESAYSRGFRSVRIGGNLILAQFELLSGNHEETLRLLTETIQEAESIPFVWLEIMGRVSLARFHHRTGQTSEANQQRLKLLIKNLHANCQKSLFRPALQSFTQKIEQLLT